MFAYKEATRNPAMTQGELQAQQKELYTMRQETQNQTPGGLCCKIER